MTTPGKTTQKELLKKLISTDPQKAAEIINKVRAGRIELARENPSFFCEYVLRNENDGSAITQEQPHEDIQQIFQDHSRVIVWTHPGLGKALPLDTEVPTSAGWKLLQDIHVGDQVFDRFGRACNVIGETPHHFDEQTFEIEFDDGQKLVAGGNHQWIVREHDGHLVVRSTKELLPWADSVPLCRHVIDAPEPCSPVEALRRMGYKVDEQSGMPDYDATHVFVSNVVEVAPIELKCIEVDSPDHSFLVTRHYRVTHNCQTGTERILLASGKEVRLMDIKERTHILTFDPAQLSYKVVEAGPVQLDTKTHVYTIDLANGMKLRGTANHPVYVEGQGWTPIGVLQLGQRLMVLANDPAPHKAVQDLLPHEAWMAGFLMTAQLPDEMAETLHRDNPISSFHNAILKENVPRGSMLRYAPEETEWAETGDNLERFGLRKQIINGLMIISPDNKHPNYKHAPLTLARKLGVFADNRTRVPAKVRNSSPDLIRMFFRGLFSGNKTAFQKGVKSNQAHAMRVATVVSAHAVVRQLRKLAMEAGLDLCISSCKSTARMVTQPLWRARRAVSVRKVIPRVPEDVFVAINDQATIDRIWPGKRAVPEQAAVRFVAVHNIWRDPTPRQTYALPVHDESHCYISGGILSHNTNQISIGRTLWLLGNDVNKTILIVSNTREAATRIIGALKRYIEDSPELHEVFPHLKPGRKWSEHSFEVHRPVIRKTPSVVAVGLHGSIMGMRADEIILDDVDGPDSVSTPHAKAQAMTWIERSALSRLNPTGGRIGAIGNVWADDDILHKLSRKPGYVARKFPVINEDGEPLLPGRFPRSVIEQIKIDQGPLRFAQIYMCEARDEASALFKEDWISGCCAAGEGKSLMSTLPAAFPSGLVYTGVDLGVRQSKGSDPTVIVTAILHPDKRRQVISVKYGVWTAKEIADNISDQYNAFGGTVLVENNGAQQFLLDILSAQNNKIPVVGFETTGKKKHDPTYGVESLANEIASDQWIFPSSDGTPDGCEPAMRWLLDAMRSYQRGKHTPDGLMAMWICREGMRLEPAKKSKVRVGRLHLRPR